MNLTFIPSTNTLPVFVAASAPVMVKITEAQNQLDKATIQIYQPGYSYSSAQYSLPVDPIISNGIRTITFDIQDLLQDQLGYDLPTIAAFGLQSANNSFFTYRVQVAGSFTDSNGQFISAATAYPATGYVYAINAALQAGQGQSYLQQFVLASDGYARFLTNAPTTKLIGLGDSEYLSGLADIDTTGYTLSILKQQRDGSSGYIAVPLNNAGNYKRWDIGIGPANIATSYPGFIDENTMSYRIQIGTNETRYFVIDHSCYDTPTRVHFLNRLGAFDSFTFTGTERRKLKAESITFEKYRAANASISDRGTTTLATKPQVSLLCSTGALTEEEINWLEELLTSPVIYVEKNSQYIPVTLVAATFETSNPQQAIKTLQVELLLANNTISQRG